MAHAEPPEGVWLDDQAGPVVRPYAVTSGRARPSRGEFDLISIVVATRPTATGIGLGPEHAAIVVRCQRPISVAEIAAHLDLPVGVIRVLLGDLLDRWLIEVRAPLSNTGQAIDDQTFEAVLNGLRAL